MYKYKAQYIGLLHIIYLVTSMTSRINIYDL